jgi:hypothetical protein
MRLNIHWKRPLFYAVLPLLLFLAFVGFPPPFAPPRSTRAAQEQSVPGNQKSDRRTAPDG